MGPEQIMLLLGLAVILIVVLAALIGFVKGLKRELGWTAFLLVLLGIAWMLFGNIDAIMNWEIPSALIDWLDSMLKVNTDATSLSTWIIDVATEMVPNGEILFTEGSRATALVLGVVSSVLRAVLLIAGTIGILVLIPVLRLVIWVIQLIIKLIVLIVKLFVRIFRGKKKETVQQAAAPVQEDSKVLVTNDINQKVNSATVSVSKVNSTPKKSKKRLWGACVGAAKAMLILTLIFVPISGIISIASSVSEDSIKTINEFMNSGTTQQIEESNSMIEEVFKYIDAYQDSFVGKLMNSSEYFFEDDLSNLIFEDLLTIESHGQTIVLPEEISNYIEAFNALAPAYQNGKFDIWTYAETNPEQVQYAFDLLKDSKLIVELIPVGIEYAGTIDMVREYLESAGYDADETIEMLASIDWHQDWSLILDAVHAAIGLGDFTSEEFNVLAMNSAALKEVLTHIGSARFINELMPIVIGIAMNLDAVKEMTGGEVVELDLSNMNWTSELANFADIYGAFTELGITSFENLGLETVSTILSDETKVESVLKLLGFVVGVENGKERADLNLFSSILLPIADVIVDKTLADNAMEMFADIISLQFEQFADANVKELWYQDLASIVKVAQLAVEINALSGDLAQMDLENIEALKDVISAVLDLNLISGNVEYNGVLQELKSALLAAAIEKFEFLEPGTDWSNINWADEKGKLIGYEKEDGTYVKGILDIYGDLIQLGKDLQKEQGLEANPIDIANMHFDFDVVLADEKGRFIDLALSAIEVFIEYPESNLFFNALPNAVNKYLVPMLESVDGELGDLPLFDNLEKDEIVAEVDNLLEVLRDIASLKLTTGNPNFQATVFGEDGSKSYALSDAFARIIRSRLLSYPATEDREAQDFRGRVIRIVLKLAVPALDIEHSELDSTIIGGPVDYEGDLHKITGAIDTILSEVIDTEGELYSLLFNEEGQFELAEDLMGYFLNEQRIHSIISVLEKIFGKYNFENPEYSTTAATLIDALLPSIYHAFLQDAIPTALADALDMYHYNANPDGTLMGHHITEDINKLLYVLHEVVNMGAIDLYNEGNFAEGNVELTDKSLAHFKNILVVVTRLNVLDNNFHAIAEYALNELLKLDISENTLSRIDNEAFNDFVDHLVKEEGAIDNIVDALELLEVTDLQGIKDLVASITGAEDIVAAALDIVSNELLYEVIAVLEAIADTRIVNAFLPGAINTAIEMAKEYGINHLDFLHNMSFAALEGELVRVTAILKDIVDTNALEVYRQKDLSLINKDALEALAKDVITLAVFDDKGDLWLNAILNIANDLGKLGLDLTNVDLNDIAWKEDGKIVLSIIDEVYELGRQLDLRTFDDIKALIEKFSAIMDHIDTIATDENVMSIYNILVHVSHLDSLSRLLPVGVQYALTMVPENLNGYVEPLALDELTGAQLASDIETIANIIRTLVIDGNAIDLVKDTNNIKNISLQNLDFVQDTFRYLAELNINVIALVPGVLAQIGLDTEELELTIEDFRHDLELIYSETGIIAQVEEIALKLGYETVADLEGIVFDEPYIKSLLGNVHLVNDVIEIVELVGSFNIVNKVLPAGVDYAVEMAKTYVDLSFLQGKSYEELNGEIVRIAQIIRDIVDLGVLEVYVSGELVFFDEENLPKLISDIEELQLLDNHGNDYLNAILVAANDLLNLGLDLSVADFDNIDWAGDAQLVKEVVYLALDLVENLGIQTISDALDFVSTIATSYSSYVTEENAYILVDILRNIVRSDALSRVLPVAYAYGIDKVEQLYQFEVLSSSELAEDLQTIVEVIATVIDMGVIGYYNQGTMDGELQLVANKANIQEILGLIGGLNILNYQSEDLLRVALDFVGEMLGINFTTKITEYSVEEEFAVISAIVGHVIDVLEDNQLNTLADVMGFDFANYQSLINDETISGLIQILNETTELSVLEYTLANVISHFGAKLLTGYEVDLALTTDEAVEDYKSIIYVVTKVLSLPDLAEIATNVLGGGQFDVDLLAALDVADIAIDKLLSLNVLDGNLGGLVHFGFDKLGISSSSIEYAAISEDNDEEVLLEVIDIVRNLLIDTDIVTLSTALGLTTADIASERIINNANLVSVHDILSAITELTLLEVCLLPAYEALVYPSMTSEPLATLGNLSELYGTVEYLLDDINALADIFVEAANLDVPGIIFNDAEIDFESPAIGAIINNIFGLNYLNLNDNSANIINALASSFEMNLEGVNVNEISFAADGTAFAEAYYEFIAPVLADERFQIHKLSDLQSYDANALSEYLMEQEVISSLLQGVQEILELKTVTAGLVVGLVLVIEMIPQGYSDILDALNLTTMSGEQITSDIIDILEIALIAVNSGRTEPGLHALSLNDPFNYELPNCGPEALDQIFDLLFGLNMLEEPTGDLVEAIIKLVLPSLDVSEIDFENVSLAELHEILDVVVASLDTIVSETGVNSYNRALAYVENNVMTLEILKQEEVLRSVYAILHSVVSSDLVYEFAYPLTKAFAYDLLSAYGIDLGLLSKEKLSNDLITIVELFGKGYEFVAETGSIDYANVELFGSMVNDVFGLNILTMNLEGIIGFVNQTFGLNINPNDISLASDANSITAAYAAVVPALVSAENPFTSLEVVIDILRGAIVPNYMALATSQNALMVVDALDILVDLTLISAGAEGAVDYIKSLAILPDDLLNAIDLSAYTAYETLYPSLFNADLNTIINIVREVVLLGVVEYVTGVNDIYVMQTNVQPRTRSILTNEELLVDIIEQLFALNILNNDSEALVEAALGMANIIIPEGSYFEGLDLAENGKAISQIIPAIFDIIEHIFTDKATVSYVMAYVMEGGYLAGGMLDARLLDTETVQGLLDVLYAVLDTQVITDAILPLYQTFVGQKYPGENDLLSIYSLSAELVKEDIVNIVNALDYAVENKLMDYVKSYLYQYEVTVDYSTDMIANLVETVLSLNILQTKEVAILATLADVLQTKYSVGELSEIVDFKNDAKVLADFVYKVQTAVLARDDSSYTSLHQFATMDIYQFLAYATQDEIGNELIDAIRGLEDLTILNAGIRVGVEMANGMLEGFIGVEELLEHYDLTDSQILGDFNSIINILEVAVEVYGSSNLYNLAMGLLSGDMSAINALDVYAVMDTLSAALHNISDLHMTENAYDDLVLFGIKALGVDPNEVDLTNVDFDQEFATLDQVVLLARVALVNSLGNESATYAEVAQAFTDGYLLTNENYEIIIDAVVKLLELDILAEAVLPVYNHYVYNTMNLGDYQEFIDLSDYPSGYDLIAEVSTLVSSLRPLSAIDIVGVILEALNQDKSVSIYFGSEEIKNVLQTVFELNYFEYKEEAIFDLLTSFAPVDSLTTEDFTSILAIKEDAAELAALVSYVLDAVVEELFKYPSDFMNMSQLDINKLLDSELLKAIVDGLVNTNDGVLRDASETTLFYIAYIVGLEFVENIVAGAGIEGLDEYVSYFDNSIVTVSQKEAIEDLNTIFDIVEVAANNNIINFVEGTFDYLTLKINDVITVVQYALPELVQLNLVKGDANIGGIIYTILNHYGISADLAELQALDYTSLMVELNGVLTQANVELRGNGYVIINDLLNIVNDDLFFVVGLGLIALDMIIDLPIADAVIPAVYEFIYNTYLINQADYIVDLGDMSFYADYEGASLVNDLRSIIAEVRTAYESGIIDILTDQNSQIKFVEVTNALVGVINVIFDTTYYQAKEYSLINLGLSILGTLGVNLESLSVDELVEMIKLEEDSEMLGNFLVSVAENVLTEEFPAQSVSEIMNIDVNAVISYLTQEDVLIAVVESLRELAYIENGEAHIFSLLEAAYIVGIDFVDDLLVSLYGMECHNILATKGLTTEEICADVVAIFDVVETVVETNVAQLVMTNAINDLLLQDVQNALEIVDKVLSLNTLNKNLNSALVIVEQITGFDYEEAAINSVDVNTDLANIIDQLQVVIGSLIAETNYTKVGDLMNPEIKEFLSDALITSALDLVLVVLDTTIAKNLLLPTYEQLGITVPEQFTEFADLDCYPTSADLANELFTIVSSIKDVFTTDEEVANIAKDVLEGTETQVINDNIISKLAAVIETVLSTGYVSAKNDDIIGLVVEMTSLPFSVSELEIYLGNDAKAIATLVKEVLEIANSCDEFQYASEYMVMIANNGLIYYVTEILTEANVNKLLNAIDEASTTTLLRSVYVNGMAYAATIVEDMFGEELAEVLDVKGMSYSLVKEEYKVITDILRKAVEAGVLETVKEILNGTDILTAVKPIVIADYEGVVAEVLTALTKLHVLEGDLDTIAEFFLREYSISDKELTSVKEDILALIPIINKAITLAADNGYEQVADFFEIVIPLTDNAAYTAIEIVRDILALQIVDVIALDAYNNLFYNNASFEDSIATLLDLSSVYEQSSDLVDEIDTILAAAQNLVDTNLVKYGAALIAADYINGTSNNPIENELADQIGNLVKGLLGTTYVAKQNDNIVNLVVDMLRISDLVEEGSIYLPLDTELADTVVALIKAAISVEGFEYVTAYTNVDNVINGLLVKEVVSKAIDALEISAGTSVLATAYRVGVKLLSNYLGGMYTNELAQLINADSLPDLLVAEEYAVLFDIIRLAADLGAVEEVRKVVVDKEDVMKVVSDIYVPVYDELAYAVLTAMTELYVFDGKLGEIASYFINYYGYSELTVAHEAVEADIITLISIIESVVALAEDNNIVLVSEYMNIPTTYIDLLTDANVYNLIDIVKDVLDLNLVNVYALDIYNNVYFNLLMGEEEIISLFDLLTVYSTNDKLVSEAKEVLTAVQNLVNEDLVPHGLVSIYMSYINANTEAVITEELSAQVANVVEVVLGSRYVLVNHNTIVELVLEMAQLTELVDATAIYLPHDADELAQTVEALLNTIISVPGYNQLGSYIHNSVDAHINALLTNEVVLGALEALEHSTSTTVLGTAYRTAAQILVDKLGAPYSDIIDTNITDAVAALDYATLFDVVRVAVSAGLVEKARDIVVNGHDVMVVVNSLVVEDYEVVINAVINAIPELQLTNGLLDDIAEAVLEQYKLSDEELDSVDFVVEANTINSILDKVITLASVNGFETVEDYRGIASVDYKEYITDSNAETLINIAREVLTLQTVNAVALDVYNALVYNGLEAGNIKELLDLTSVYGTNAALIAEVDHLLDVAHTLPKVGLVSIVKDALNGTKEVQITSEVVKEVADFIEVVLGTHYVAVNNNVLVAKALTYVPGVDYTAEELAIDLAADAQEIRTLFEVVANILVADPAFQYGSDIKAHASVEGAKEMAKVFLTRENALEVIDTLDQIAEATFMVAAAKVAVLKAEAALAAYDTLADLIDRSRMDNDLYVEDVRTVLGILEQIVLAEPKEDIIAVYNNREAIKDINIMKYTDVMNYVLETIPTINVIKNGLGDTLINAINAANARGLNVVLSSTSVNAIQYADYEVEFAAYGTILTNLFTDLAPVIGHNGELTINDLIDCAKSLRVNAYSYETFNAVVNPVLDAVDAFVECELVSTIAIDIYNGVLPLVGNETLIELLTLDAAYTTANFEHDAQIATDILRVLAESNLYQAIYAKSIKGLDARGNGIESVQELITFVSSLDFLSLNNNAKFVEAIKLVAAYADIQGLYNVADEFADIDLVSEGAIVSTMVPELVEVYKALSANNLRPDLFMIGDTELMAHVINIYETAITLETAEIILPVLANDYVLPALYNVTVKVGRPVERFNRTYAPETIMKVANKGTAALDALMELGVFSNNGVNLANEAGTATNEEIVRIYDIFMEYAPVPARVKPWLENLVQNAYMLGNIPLDYSNMRFADEKAVVVEVIALAKELASQVSSLASSRDIAGLAALETDVVELYNKAMESEIMSQLAIPAMNMAYIALAEQYVFVLFDEADGVTADTFADEVIAPLFAALRNVSKAINLAGGFTYHTDQFYNINLAIDEIVNAAFVNGGAATSQNLEQLMRRAVLLVTKQHLSDEVVATDEVAVLKELVLCVADLLEAGVYSGGVQLDNLLSEAGLDALSQTFEAMYHSTAVYELKDWGLDILKPQLPHSVYNMVAEATAEELRHDTHEAAIIFSYLADSHFYQDGHIHLEVGGPAALAAAIKEMTNLDIMDGHEAEIFKLLIDRVGLAKLDSSLDPIANVESAIENEDWSWDKEFYALADLVASLDGILASGTMLEENGSIKFENLLECKDVAALTATLKAFNHVRSLRSMILTVVDENLGSMASGSFDVTEFFSDSFKDQLDSKEMADVAYWDAEMESLAKIVVKVDALNTDVNTMTDADVDVLVDVLHIMNNSELFVVDPIVSILEEQLEDYDVTLGDTSSWDEAKWDEEIDNIGDLLKEIISVDSLDANTIKNMPKADLIELLTAMNHSELTRVALPKVIDEAVKSALQPNTNVEYDDLVDAWLTNQVNGTMEDVATWDAEILVLADIITAIKDDSIFDVENATSYDAIEGLLFDIKDSKSFKLAFLTKLMSSSLEPLVGTASLGLMGDDSDPRWGNETEGEIVYIIAVLEAAKAIDAFDGTFDITTKSEAQISGLLTAMNHSIILRVALPKAIKDASASLNTDEFLTSWINDQNESNMKGVAEWDAEIEKLVKVIDLVNDSSINFSSISFDSIDYDELEAILKAMNATSSFTVDGIVSDINDQLDTNGFDTTVASVYDRNANGSNKDEWNNEIERLVDIIEVLATIDNFNVNNPELGGLLDTMAESYIFGNDTKDNDSTFNHEDTDNAFNGLILEILGDANLLSTSANGFIDADDAKEDDWSAYDWSSELAIIQQFDTSAASQGHEFLKVAQGSDIIVKYFDIATTLNEEIAEYTYIIPLTSSINITIKLADHINGGNPLTNEGLAARNWEKEVEAIEDVQGVFSDTVALADFAKVVEAKAATYNSTPGTVNLLAVEACHSMKLAIIAEFDNYSAITGKTGAEYWAALIA